MANVHERTFDAPPERLATLIADLGGIIEHYHQARPYQGLEQRRPDAPLDVIAAAAGRVERPDRLGGLIHEYSRAA